MLLKDILQTVRSLLLKDIASIISLTIWVLSCDELNYVKKSKLGLVVMSTKVHVQYSTYSSMYMYVREQSSSKNI
jgi:hypothetical protein